MGKSCLSLGRSLLTKWAKTRNLRFLGQSLVGLPLINPFTLFTQKYLILVRNSIILGFALTQSNFAHDRKYKLLNFMKLIAFILLREIY
jgi:hypothetical protein